MSEKSKISPQGYVYGIKPTSDNPFWGSGEITGDYVSNVEFHTKSGTNFDTGTLTVEKSDGSSKEYQINQPLSADTDIVTGMQVTQETSATKTDIHLSLRKGRGSVEEDLPTITIPLGGGSTVVPDIEATASVDSSVGMPSVTVTKTGTDENPKFAFDFTGLRGSDGKQGPQGEQGATPDIAATASVTSAGDTGVTVTKTGTASSPSFDFAFTGIGSGSGGSSLQWTDTAWLTCNYYGSDGATAGDQVKMNITVTQGVASYSGVAYAKLQSVSPVQLATTPCIYVLTNNADITDQHLIMQSGTYINMSWDSSTSGYTGSYGLRELYSSSTSPLNGAYFGVYCEKISGGSSGVSSVTPSVTVENKSDGSSSEYMLQKTSVAVDVDGVSGTAETSIKTPARVVTGVSSVGVFDYGTTCYLEAKTTMGGTTEWKDDVETSPLITPKGDSETSFTDLMIGGGGSIKTQKPLKFDGAGNVQILNPFDGETVEQTIALGGGGSGGSGLPTPLSVTLQSRSGQMITSSGVGMLTIQLWNNATRPTDGITTKIPVPYCYNDSLGQINATTLFSGFSIAGETVNFMMNVSGQISTSSSDLTLKIYRYSGGSSWTADTFTGFSYWAWTPGV